MIKIITLDVETAPRIGLFFGNTYNASIAKVIQNSYVMGFSWKPLGKKVQSCFIWDFKLYKKEPRNDIEVVKKWIEVVSKAQIVVGHNSRAFDDKVMMGRVIAHRLPPPIPFNTVDTKSDLKKVSRNDSNKLDDLASEYGYGHKNDTGGIDLWWDCMNRDKKAQKKMVRYCERDVALTEKMYLHERPYIKHPPLNVLQDNPEGCPKCGGVKVHTTTTTVRKVTTTKTYRYYRCGDCRGMLPSRVPDDQIVKMRYGQ